MKNISFIILLMLSIASCSKFLDEKPDEKLSTISSLDDCQAILDRNLYVNKFGVGALESSSDNFYLNEDYWSIISDENKNLYTWQPYNLFPIHGFDGNDWSSCYNNIFRSNVVLESVDKFQNNPEEFRNVKGQAYFIRAHHFLQAAWTWSLSYNKSTAKNLLGIPLRIGTNFNEAIGRSTLEQTYLQIISDARMATELLPVTPKHIYRPSKVAALSLLARVFLSMNEYDSSYKYGNLALSHKSDLINYNNPDEVQGTEEKPFRNFNKEVIFEYASNPLLTNTSTSFIDSNLVNSYTEFDIRKSAFFKPVGKHWQFKGSYNNSSIFTGITTAEILLMKAESAARIGYLAEALEGLNLLRFNRIQTEHYVPAEIIDKAILIDSIINERRRELVMRSLRFMDIKRLNELGANISLNRFINGKTYTLPANDLRFALAIPEDIVNNSAIIQNPR